MTTTITYCGKQITVYQNQPPIMTNLKTLYNKMNDMALNFEFRRKLKTILYIELISGCAILHFADQTKLYL